MLDRLRTSFKNRILEIASKQQKGQEEKRWNTEQVKHKDTSKPENVKKECSDINFAFDNINFEMLSKVRAFVSGV